MLQITKSLIQIYQSEMAGVERDKRAFMVSAENIQSSRISQADSVHCKGEAESDFGGVL